MDDDYNFGRIDALSMAWSSLRRGFAFRYPKPFFSILVCGIVGHKMAHDPEEVWTGPGGRWRARIHHCERCKTFALDGPSIDQILELFPDAKKL